MISFINFHLFFSIFYFSFIKLHLTGHCRLWKLMVKFITKALPSGDIWPMSTTWLVKTTSRISRSTLSLTRSASSEYVRFFNSQICIRFILHSEKWFVKSIELSFSQIKEPRISFSIFCSQDQTIVSCLNLNFFSECIYTIGLTDEYLELFFFFFSFLSVYSVLVGAERGGKGKEEGNPDQGKNTVLYGEIWWTSKK